MATKADVKELKRKIPLFKDVMGFAEDYTEPRKHKKTKR